MHYTGMAALISHTTSSSAFNGNLAHAISLFGMGKGKKKSHPGTSAVILMAFYGAWRFSLVTTKHRWWTANWACRPLNCRPANKDFAVFGGIPAWGSPSGELERRAGGYHLGLPKMLGVTADELTSGVFVR